MTELGDLLETVYRAPLGAPALHLRADERVDHTAMYRFHEWVREERERQQGSYGSSTALLVAGTGERPEGWQETSHELWRLGPGRWRADTADRISARVGDELLSFSPGIGGMRSPVSPGSMHPWSALVEPRWVIDRFEIAIGDPAAVAGRDCWTVELHPTAPSMPWHHMRMMMGPWIGQEHSCRIDRGTGIILELEHRFEGEICATWITTTFELPSSLDPGMFDFTPPDGSGFRTHLELRVDKLRQSGVDVSDIDVTDEAQVNQATMAQHAGFFGHDPRTSAEAHIPTGPPPDDIDAAETQVRDAYDRIVSLSDDGEAVPAVEGGENLGPCLRQAGERAPGGPNLPATGRVEHVKFLNRDEAVVWFTLLRGGNPVLGTMEGRARLVGSQWLVSRATFAQIVASVGVRCPPPPDAPSDA